MEAAIDTRQFYEGTIEITSCLDDRAFEPEIIDEDGRVVPRFRLLLGDLEWSSLDVQTRIGLMLHFVASLESDVISTLHEIPF